MTIKELTEKAEAQEVRISTLEAQIESLMRKIESLTVKKGPSSQREMTLEDAERVINGDLKDVPHKKAAETLNLSYGQVYSARGGYTFKNVTKKK